MIGILICLCFCVGLIFGLQSRINKLSEELENVKFELSNEIVDNIKAIARLENEVEDLKIKLKYRESNNVNK